MNNTSCNQLKVVPEPEIQAPTAKVREHGVGDTRNAGSMIVIIARTLLFLETFSSGLRYPYMHTTSLSMLHLVYIDLSLVNIIPFIKALF